MYDIKYDINLDGFIDELDLAIFKSHYLETITPDSSPEAKACDFDGDGFVGAEDFSLFGEKYTPGTIRFSLQVANAPPGAKWGGMLWRVSPRWSSGQMKGFSVDHDVGLGAPGPGVYKIRITVDGAGGEIQEILLEDGQTYYYDYATRKVTTIAPPIVEPQPPVKQRLSLAGFLPMLPEKGPPLPVFLNLYWPWYIAKEG